MIKSVFIILNMTLLLYACNTKETPRPLVEIKSFTLHGIGEFDFSEDVILLLNPQDKNQISIHTNPTNAIIQFHWGKGNEYIPLKFPLEIGSESGRITFIAKKGNYRPSKPRSLTVSLSATQYLKDLQISPTLAKDSLHLFMDNNARGAIGLSIFTPYGVRLYDNLLLKQTNELNLTLDISSYDRGVYFMLVQIGAGGKTFKFIKK